MIHLGRRAWWVAAVAFMAGCGNSNTTTTPQGPAEDAAPPPITTAVVDAGVVVAAAPIDAGAAALPTTDPGDADDSMCGGADVDLVAVLANRRCRTRSDAPASPDGWAQMLKLKLSAAPEKIAPSGHVEITLEVTNTGKVAVPMYFAGDLTLAALVADAKGGRVTPPTGNAPKNPEPRCLNEQSCRNPTSHVVIAPGGKAHAKITWDAVKAAWPKTGPTACCAIHVEPVSAGPLAVGTYKVKLPLPYESAQGAPADPEITVRVAK